MVLLDTAELYLVWGGGAVYKTYAETFFDAVDHNFGDHWVKPFTSVQQNGNHVSAEVWVAPVGKRIGRWLNEHLIDYTKVGTCSGDVYRTGERTPGRDVQNFQCNLTRPLPNGFQF
jgi:hypothetical protein